MRQLELARLPMAIEDEEQVVGFQTTESAQVYRQVAGLRAPIRRIVLLPVPDDEGAVVGPVTGVTVEGQKFRSVAEGDQLAEKAEQSAFVSASDQSNQEVSLSWQ